MDGIDELDLSQLSIDCLDDINSSPSIVSMEENKDSYSELNHDDMIAELDISQLSLDNDQETVTERDAIQAFSRDEDMITELDISQLSFDFDEDHPRGDPVQPTAFSTPKKTKQNEDIYEFQDSDDEVISMQSPLQLEEDESSLDGSRDISCDLLSSDEEQIGNYRLSSHISARALDMRKCDTIKKQLNRKYLSKIGSSSMKRAMHSKCYSNCKKKCLKKISKAIMKNARRCYWSKTPQERKMWLIEQIRHSEVSKFQIENGPKVCQFAFYTCLGIHRATFFQRKRAALAQGLGYAKSRNRRLSQASIICLNWMEDYITNRGDHMPHKDEVRLPHGYTKKDIYKQYLEEKSDIFDPTVSQAEFYKLWMKFFWQVKVKKTGDFSKCQKCVVLEMKMDKELNQSKRNVLKREMMLHNERQMNERLLYYKKRDDARNNGKKYLSLIIDGMDQSKTNLPNFNGSKAKGINDMDLLKTHVTGVILHGQHEQMTFVDIGQHSHDSNLTINILMKVLAYVSKGKQLPPILYIQADNCWRENKNKYVMAFCEMLVAMKIFHEVYLSFLLVGHTHEDVDQLFSQIRRKLNKTSTETMPQLLSLLPNSQEINGLFDFKGWVEPHLTKVTGHTRPHHFKFMMDGDTVTGHFKGLKGQDWQPLSGGFLKRTQQGRTVCPTGKPKYLEPRFINIPLERLLQKTEDWALLFSGDVEYQWWHSYISGLIQVRDTARRRKKYMTQNIIWVIPRLPPYSPEDLGRDEEPSEPAIAPEMARKLALETENPKVHITRQKQQHE